MKLYGFPPTRSIRVLWTLRELDVEFEFVKVDPTKGEHRRSDENEIPLHACHPCLRTGERS